MPNGNTADELADLDARIADTEMRMFQHQKRIENLLARGVDTAEAKSALAVLQETLANLRASRADLDGRR